MITTNRMGVSGDERPEMVDQIARSALAAGRVLVPELSDIECVRRSGYASENRQGNEGGYDGLHGYYSRRCRQHHRCLSSMSRMMPLCHEHRCLARDKFRNIFNGLVLRSLPRMRDSNTIDLGLQVKDTRGNLLPQGCLPQRGLGPSTYRGLSLSACCPDELDDRRARCEPALPIAPCILGIAGSIRGVKAPARLGPGAFIL